MSLAHGKTKHGPTAFENDFLTLGNQQDANYQSITNRNNQQNLITKISSYAQNGIEETITMNSIGVELFLFYLL